MSIEQTPTDTTPSDPIEPSTAATGGIRFAMVVLYVRDLERSVAFYRLLGLEVSDPPPDRPVAMYREGGALRMILTTDAVARRYDPARAVPEGPGYQQMVEFFVDDDTAVDAAWTRLRAAGHAGRSAPAHLSGPYAAVVDDPDGNVVLITHDPANNQ